MLLFLSFPHAPYSHMPLPGLLSRHHNNFVALTFVSSSLLYPSQPVSDVDSRSSVKVSSFASVLSAKFSATASISAGFSENRIPARRDAPKCSASVHLTDLSGIRRSAQPFLLSFHSPLQYVRAGYQCLCSHFPGTGSSFTLPISCSIAAVRSRSRLSIG